MLRLSVNHSRKVSQDFCSRQFGASVEAEIPDGTETGVLQKKALELFEFVQGAVADQIVKASAAARGSDDGAEAGNGHARPAPQVRAPRVPQDGGNGNGRARRNGQPVMATAAQKKAIAAICADRGLQIEEVLADWDGDIERLSVKEASGVIDALKGKPAGNGARR